MTETTGAPLVVTFTATLTDEAPWLVARRPDADVVSQGDSVDRAPANLEEAQPRGRG